MLEVSNLKIRQFLQDYPQSTWNQCIELVCTIGINYIRSNFSTTLPIPILEDLANQQTFGYSAPELSQKLQQMQQEIENYAKQLEKNARSHSTPQRNQKKAPQKTQRQTKLPLYITEETPRFQDLDNVFHSKTTGRIRHGAPVSTRDLKSPKIFKKNSAEIKGKISPKDNKASNPSFRTSSRKPQSSARKVPNYLKNVDSKIKTYVKKDIEQYKAMAKQSKNTGSCEDQERKGYLEQVKQNEKYNTGNQKELHRQFPGLQQQGSFNRNVSSTMFTDEIKSNQNSLQKMQQPQLVYDTEFETPRYPNQPISPKKEETGELMKIADYFLKNPLMAHLQKRTEYASSDDENIIKSTPISPLVSMENSEIPFHQGWYKAPKDSENQLFNNSRGEISSLDITNPSFEWKMQKKDRSDDYTFIQGRRAVSGDIISCSSPMGDSSDSSKESRFYDFY